MAEAVRLVIWDLDETFWKGTLTEGGIEKYSEHHHSIVVELASRGIMSSICSKNDPAPTLEVLTSYNILDYFIFPSISWEPKGHRLYKLIETIGMRPSSVMFIDDNPNNRAEAKSIMPSLQVESELFLSNLLSDPRFIGRNDKSLDRLKQYKLLEKKKRDETAQPGGNQDFLRGCDIRVLIDYDVLSHLDRAIELINRTNQLNFTKVRLSENMDEARIALRKAVDNRWRQSGLIRVIDKYGDYGFVGFFMVENGSVDRLVGRLTQSIIHYCFSCRTLGMLVERWFYDWLQRPRIKVVGEVLTDLNSSYIVDWIRLVGSNEFDAAPLIEIAPEIRVHGGCEAASIAHYLGAYTKNLIVTGNFHAGTHFVRLNSAPLLLSACDRKGPEFADEAEVLNLPYEMLISRYFDDVPRGTLFVFGGQYDAPGPNRHRHKTRGWEIKIEPHGLENLDVARVSLSDLTRKLDGLPFPETSKNEIRTISQHIRSNYESISYPDDEALTSTMHDLFNRVPVGSMIILMLDDNRIRNYAGEIQDAPWSRFYSKIIRKVALGYSFVGTVSFEDFIHDENEILIGGNHYDRMVYCRMAQGMVTCLRHLVAKASIS